MVEISIKTTDQQSSNKKFAKIDADYDRTMDLWIDETTCVGHDGADDVTRAEEGEQTDK